LSVESLYGVTFFCVVISGAKIAFFIVTFFQFFKTPLK